MPRERIADRYEILRLLGRGGMAEVFLAKQFGDGGFTKHVVIKRILPHLADDEDFVAMLLDEARTAAELRHPNIAHVFDVGHERGRTYIAMEFVPGQDLRRVQRRAQRDGGVPLVHALQIGIDICAGLYSAHTCRDMAGVPLEIVHRDINPQNVLVSYDGVTKIVDFGIAKARSNQSNTETGVIKGKYSYMSPEQASGLEVDARSDQFAVGIVLWELIAGKRLFKRAHDLATLAAVTDDTIPPPSKYAPITTSLDNVVMRALSRHPDDRFPDCQALMMALEDLLAEERLVHSSARVGAWMRELFADVLLENDIGVEDRTGGLADPTLLEGAPKEPRGHPRTIDDHLPSLEVAYASSQQGDEGSELPSTQIGRRGQKSVRDDVAVMAAMEQASFAVTDPGATELMSSPPSFHSMSSPEAVGALGDESSATVRADPVRIADDASESSLLEPGVLSPELLKLRRETPPESKTALTELVHRSAFVPVAPKDHFGWRAIVIGIALTAVAVVSTFVIALVAGPSTGRIVVETTPPGASVYLDGANTRRTTPTILDHVTVGVPHQVRVEKAPFASQQFELTLVSPDDEPRVSLSLDDSAPPKSAPPKREGTKR